MAKPWLAVTAAVLAVLLIRLAISLPSSQFSTDTSYFHLRQVEAIRETGRPAFTDPLGGPQVVFSPVFHYLAALPALALPTPLAAQLVSSLLAALLVIPAYLLCRMLARPGLALAAALLMTLAPAFLGSALELSPLALGLLLFLGALAAFTRIRPGDTAPFVVLVLGLAASHPIALLFALGLGCYLLLLLVLGQKIHPHELEASLFAIAFTLWAQFLLFKRLIAAHGFAVVWQNIPPELFAEHFASVTVPSAAYLIGLVPLVLGVLVLYRTFIGAPRREVFLIAGFIAASALTLWARLIPLRTGLLLLGILLALLVAPWLEGFRAFLLRSRAVAAAPWLLAAALAAAFTLTALPALATLRADATALPHEDVLAALAWLRDQSDPGTVVLALPQEGHLVAALAQRRPVLDTNFLLRTDARQRLLDVRRAFVTAHVTEAVDLFTKYGATHLLITPRARSQYRLKADPAYVTDACFIRVFARGETAVYWKDPDCILRTVAR
jgi:hypothetical protein